jgi:hypothetical protein
MATVAEDRCCVEMIRDRLGFRGFANGERAPERSAPVRQPKEKWRFSMKKTIKKLALAKETLRNLNEDQIANVAGGITKRYSDCGSCGIACTVIDCTP